MVYRSATGVGIAVCTSGFLATSITQCCNFVTIGNECVEIEPNMDLFVCVFEGTYLRRNTVVRIVRIAVVALLTREGVIIGIDKLERIVGIRHSFLFPTVTTASPCTSIEAGVYVAVVYVVAVFSAVVRAETAGEWSGFALGNRGTVGTYVFIVTNKSVTTCGQFATRVLVGVIGIDVIHAIRTDTGQAAIVVGIQNAIVALLWASEVW